MNAKLKRALWIVLGVLFLLALLGFAVLPSFVARAMNGTVEAERAPPSAEAVRLHATLDVADLHGDALLWRRDLLERGAWGHIDLPRMVEGRLALQAFTTVTKTPRDMNIEANPGDTDNITLLTVLQGWPVQTWSSLRARALHQADKLRDFAQASDGGLVIVESRADLERVLEERTAGGEALPVAAFLGIEGAHALEADPASVDTLFQAGFRMFGLTHFFDNAVGGSAHGVDKGGLTDLGARVLDRMEELHILVDLAHASPALIDDVLERTTRPVVVSHTGVKGTCDNRRNLDDDRLRRIAETGGVVGIGLWETALCGTTPADWARAVRHAADVAGVGHVGLGSDWDGAVEAIVDAAGTVHLVDALLAEGFTEDEIRWIMGENVTRVLLESLPEG